MTPWPLRRKYTERKESKSTLYATRTGNRRGPKERQPKYIPVSWRKNSGIGERSKS